MAINMMPIHGDPVRRVQAWACDICGQTKRDEITPECPVCGVAMVPVKDGKR